MVSLVQSGQARSSEAALQGLSSSPLSPSLAAGVPWPGLLLGGPRTLTQNELQGG